MQTIKTNELTGAALDWAVAKCEGHVRPDGGFYAGQQGRPLTRYSTDWSQGGPIIERGRIGVWPSDSMEGMWAARPDYKFYPERLPPAYGPTLLIAAMRCYVASKLGDTVEVPAELAVFLSSL